MHGNMWLYILRTRLINSMCLYVRGTCRSPHDYLRPSDPEQVTRLDEQEILVLLKNDDGTFDVSEINGQDAHAGGGSPWVCD